MIMVVVVVVAAAVLGRVVVVAVPVPVIPPALVEGASGSESHHLLWMCSGRWIERWKRRMAGVLMGLHRRSGVVRVDTELVQILPVLPAPGILVMVMVGG